MAVQVFHSFISSLLIGLVAIGYANGSCSGAEETTIDDDCLTTYESAVTGVRCKNIDCASEYDVVIDCLNGLTLTRSCINSLQTVFDDAMTSISSTCIISQMIRRCPSASTLEGTDTTVMAPTTVALTTLVETTTRVATTEGDALTTTQSTTTTTTTAAEITPEPTTSSDWVPDNGVGAKSASLMAVVLSGAFMLMIKGLC